MWSKTALVVAVHHGTSLPSGGGGGGGERQRQAEGSREQFRPGHVPALRLGQQGQPCTGTVGVWAVRCGYRQPGVVGTRGYRGYHRYPQGQATPPSPEPALCRSRGGGRPGPRPAGMGRPPPWVGRGPTAPGCASASRTGTAGTSHRPDPCPCRRA